MVVERPPVKSGGGDWIFVGDCRCVSFGDKRHWMPSDCDFGASPAFGATTVDSCLCLPSSLPLPALFRSSYLFQTLPCALLRNPSASLPLSGNLARHHGCCPRLRPSSPPLPHLYRHNPHHYTQPSRRHTRSGRKCTSLQPFSQKSLTATVPKVFQIGLCGVVEADLELFCNSWSVGFLGERLYKLLYLPTSPKNKSWSRSAPPPAEDQYKGIRTTRRAGNRGRAGRGGGFKSSMDLESPPRRENVPRTENALGTWPAELKVDLKRSQTGPQHDIRMCFVAYWTPLFHSVRPNG